MAAVVNLFLLLLQGVLSGQESGDVGPFWVKLLCRRHYGHADTSTVQKLSLRKAVGEPRVAIR